jgi:hypothetical protein
MHWKSQNQAVKELEQEGYITVKTWIGKHRENEINIGRLRDAKIDKSTYSGLNSNIYQKVYSDSFIPFLDMFRRNPSQYVATHQEVINLYNYLFDYFSELLYRNKIELMLFYNLPHFGSDYLLVTIAKYMNIKMILMYQSLIPNRFHYITDVDDFGKFETAKVKFDYPYQKVNFEHRKVQFYMKNIRLKYRSCNYNLLVSLRRYIFRRVSRKTFLGIIKSYTDCITFKFQYNQFKIDSVDFSKKFIYFPLQLQPELTTSTLGGVYNDQLLAIEKLSNMIPDDWLIYVKENPKQLGFYRGSNFFKRLLLISKAIYISKNVNSFELIGRCQFVSTISGTAGWEAITSNRCCLIFGKAWYQEFEGIFRYREDLKYNEIMEFEIDKEVVEENYNSFIKTTANGIIDNGHVPNFKEYSDTNNTIYIKESLIKLIGKLF